VLRAFRAGAAVASRLPEPVVFAVAHVLAAGWMIGAGRARRQVARNLRRVHGRSFRGWRLGRDVYRTFDSYARYWAESLRLPGTPPDRLDAGIDVPAIDLVHQAREAGNGVILALPHLGGWEWGGFWLAEVQDLPVSVVVERLEPTELFDWFAELRQAFGMNVIPLDRHAGTEVLRALRANHVVCLLCDRDFDEAGVEVEFFGERTTLPGGPATLAFRAGAPLLPAAVYFDGRRHLGIVRPAVPAERRGRLREDVGRVTQTLAGELEGLVRRAPEQWHLLQPNWPSDRKT
jgi:KDO2-lipid IV(A) lauroyltransferase